MKVTPLKIYMVTWLRCGRPHFEILLPNKNWNSHLCSVDHREIVFMGLLEFRQRDIMKINSFDYLLPEILISQ